MLSVGKAKATTTYSLVLGICPKGSITLFLGRNHPPLNLIYALQLPFLIQVRLSIPPNRPYPYKFCEDEVLEICVTPFRHVTPEFWIDFLLDSEDSQAASKIFVLLVVGSTSPV